MASHAKKVSHGFVGDNPGWVATLFALVVTAIFLGLIYNAATTPHAGGGHNAAAPHGAADHGGQPPTAPPATSAPNPAQPAALGAQPADSAHAGHAH